MRRPSCGVASALATCPPFISADGLEAHPRLSRLSVPCAFQRGRMDFLANPEVGPLIFILLSAASFATAFIGVFTGAAGGVILLGIMAIVLPPTALIPVHTVVMLGSGVTRTAIM